MQKRSACTSSPVPTVRKPGIAVASVGFWFLVTFFCLNLSTSLLAYPSRGLEDNLNEWLDISENLINVSNVALNQFEKKFPCNLTYISIKNPKNEDTIRRVCMPGYCSSGEKILDDEASCIDTIYSILINNSLEIKDFDTPDLLSALNHMIKALKPEEYKITGNPLSSGQNKLNPKYEMKIKQCKIFLTLQQLAQTINRIFCHQKSVGSVNLKLKEILISIP